MRTIAMFFLIVFGLTSTGLAAPSYKISGRLVSADSADTALLLSKSKIKRASINAGKFSFSKLNSATLKNSKLYFFKDGAPVGPGALKEAGGYKFLNFSGKAPEDKTSVKLAFSLEDGYLLATKRPNKTWISKTKVADANFTGASLGYPGATGSSFKAGAVTASDAEEQQNSDSDSDGVPNVLDIDDDNDGITDERDSNGGSVISSIYADYSDTINAHLGNLDDTSIENLFASENVFSLTIFMGTSGRFPTATGGHVVCDASQVICRSTADGGTTSYYTGVSESDPAVQGQVWSSYNADGSGKPNLEPVTFSGSSEIVLVGAIQPRSAAFSSGELITANVTNGSTILGTRVFSILPPNISTPMLLSYNAGSGVQTVDYDDSFAPGSSSGNPIVLTGGEMTFNFYPPQRRAIPGVESDGAYRDIGNSNIGILIGGSGISSEFTCAGLYSGLSSGITELPTSESMPGGAIAPSSGAILWPLTDSTSDVAHTSGTLKSVTVNLSTCLSRASISPGTYMVTIMYAGTDTSFGAPRAGQMVHVTIP